MTIWNLLQDFNQIISTTSESRELLELIKGRYCSFLSNCDLIFEIWSFGKREKYKNQFNTTSICMRNFILIKILSETRIKVLRLSLKAFNFTKINTPPRVFFTFLKLYKSHQIAQHIYTYMYCTVYIFLVCSCRDWVYTFILFSCTLFSRE